MNAVIYFFGSGTAFFAGVALLLAAVGLAGRGLLARVASSGLFLVGLALVVLSATPLPFWMYGIAAVATGLWQVGEKRKKRWSTDRLLLVRLTAIVVWLGTAAYEAQYRFLPMIPQTEFPQLTIVGDSVSAGTGEKGVVPWPRQFGDDYGVGIDDRSRVGATVRSALQRATAPIQTGVVLLEIGGNDLLGDTRSDDFERDLDELLGRVCGPGRIVVMFELPLPPFANGFGRAQRRLAERYGVVLVPKRVFIEILTTDGMTTDGIHLSAEGHARMAGEVWAILRPAFANTR